MLEGKRHLTHLGACAASAVSLIAIAGAQTPHAGPDSRIDRGARGEGRSLVQRPPRPSDRTQEATPAAQAPPAHFPFDFRTIDGWSNNPMHPERGSTGFEFLRLTTVGYANGIGAPAGSSRVSARTVSNLCVSQSASIESAAGASDYLWQWGQFLDHDITETPIADPGDAFDILVPTGDVYFDPFATGVATIPLDRSAYVMADGVRQQLNNITAFIDASNVYGSDEERATALRTMDGTGRLRTSADDLLPFNTGGLDNAPTGTDPSFFLAGDIRANEQIGLTAMHTLFVREHNHWADEISQLHPSFSGDELYEHARAVVAAEMQAITYREFLPLLLGPGALPPYTGYRPQVDPGIANVFATAAYRVGHTMLSPTLLRVDASGAEIAAGHISLANSFFTPQEVIDHGIEPLLRGLASQRSQEIDVQLIDEVRNFLFGPPGSGGFDLASLNIQRGRDHGLPGYNQIRMDFGLSTIASFTDAADPVDAANLAAAYGDVDEIDAWVGMLCEPHVPGALVGETHRAVLGDQFRRLRDGDRFWYESYLPPHMVAMVNQQTLATVIRRNTSIGAELQDDVFVVSAPCRSDLGGDAAVGTEDLLQVLAAWGPCPGCAEDLDDDGVVSTTDLLTVLADWGGCP